VTIMRPYTNLGLFLFFITSCFASDITRSAETSVVQDSLVQLASRYYNEGDFKRVIALKNPADTLTLSSKLVYYKGMSYSALYDYPRAIGCFQTAINGDSANVIYRFQYGRLLILSGFLERAADELSACTHMDSTYLPASYQLGLLYNMQGDDPDKECEIFSFLIRQNPEDFMSLYYLGSTITRTGYADSGAVFIQRSIAVNPQYYPSLIAMAHYYDGKKEYAPALEYYKKALEIRPHDKDLLFKTGECYRKSGALNEAVACFKNAIAIDSLTDAVHAQLGKAYYSLGKFDSSVQSYAKAIKIDDDNVTYYKNISLAYQKIDSVNAAIRMLQKGMAALHPEDLMFAHTSLASLYNTHKRTQDAVGMYKKYISDAYMELAAYYQSNNMRSDVIEVYQHVVELDPANYEILFRLADLYAEINDNKAAINIYTKMMQSFRSGEGQNFLKQKIESLKKNGK
jgi:tetratricopeptide (TPR) repeat protein